MIERRAVLVTAAIGAAIAAFAPFDRLFTQATLGIPLAAAAFMALLAWLGATMGHDAGFRLAGHSARSPVVTGLVGAIGMALYVLLIDLVIFRGAMPAGFLDYLNAPLHERLAYFMPRAFTENILYRLFGFGLAVWIARRLSRRERLGWPALLVLATLVQAVNIAANVGSAMGGPLTATTLAYDALRYVVPGVVWAVLYVRNGFTVAEIASVGCHIFLQPGFSLLR